jgi:poly(A) polymerase
VPVPVIIPRQSHRISRRNIDPEALKVLYRLHEHKHIAYLVGGSVRDLLLERKPKDFDVGTDAHPYQIKKIFRNCWIIGRRFRLAHVKFGPKTIEVATFRRIVPDAPPALVDAGSADPEAPESVVIASAAPDTAAEPHGQPNPPATRHDSHAYHKDNTFGTPEEDAFRRDFTINGLFYDIATYSVIDYVGGLEDLERGVIRSIGDPHVRFVEDPVRMLRAVVMSSRLGFEMDPLVVEAIAEHKGLLAKASPARLLEEYYKILRSGCAEVTFRALRKVGLLELVTPELRNPPDSLWQSLERVDRYRLQFPAAPPTLTNTVLMGALLAPLGSATRRAPSASREAQKDRVGFGILPVARKDFERHQQFTQLVPRLTDPGLPPRIARGILHRPVFPDALVWLEVFGEATSDHVERWRQAYAERESARAGAAAHPSSDSSHGSREGDDALRRPYRRRRRRRRRRPGPDRGTA